MRETRFRAKVLQSRKWVYGNYFMQSGNHCIQGDTLYKVDPSTLGEYIGTKDQNGIDIYTGDIVNTWSDSWNGNYEIAWDPSELLFGKKTGAESYASIAWYIDNQYHQLLIVGNVFDTPKLLD